MEALVLGALCVVVPVALVALVVVLAVTGRRRAQERTAAFGRLAAHKEWTFRPEGDDLVHRFPGDPFGRGHSRRARNVVEGRHDGRSFVAFDYSYVTESGSGDDRSSTRHSFSVTALHLGLPPQVQVPRLQVRPQGSFGRFFSTLFGTDHRIGQPAFDDAFHVSTESPRLAHDVLHPGLTAMLLAQPGGAWRLQGDSLVLFAPGAHSPASIEAVLAWGQAILAQVQPQVWSGLRGDR